MSGVETEESGGGYGEVLFEQVGIVMWGSFFSCYRRTAKRPALSRNRARSVEEEVESPLRACDA
jgi:hypothetical protein